MRYLSAGESEVTLAAGARTYVPLPGLTGPAGKYIRMVVRPDS